MTFRLKAYDNRGDLITLGQFDDEKFYQDFFAKVDKEIFIQKENIQFPKSVGSHILLYATANQILKHKFINHNLAVRPL